MCQITLEGFKSFKTLDELKDIDIEFKSELKTLIKEDVKFFVDEIIKQEKEACKKALKEAKKEAKQTEKALKQAKKQAEKEAKMTKKALAKAEAKAKKEEEREAKRKEREALKEAKRKEREEAKRLKEEEKEKWEKLQPQMEIYVEDNEFKVLGSNLYPNTYNYYMNEVLGNQYLKLSQKRKLNWLKENEKKENRKLIGAYKKFGLVKKFLLLRSIELNGFNAEKDLSDIKSLKGNSLKEYTFEVIRGF